MQFSEILRRRKMVRGFTEEPVAREVVERIVERARKAPTAGFSQGIRFVVVTEPEQKRAVASAANESWYRTKWHKTDDQTTWLSDAPVQVVVCTREEDYRERYRRPDKAPEDGTAKEWEVPWWYADAGKAIMLLLLAAVDEGLGAGMFAFTDTDACRATLGIPDDVKPVAAVTIGHPAERQMPGSSKRLPRRPLEEVVRWERW